MRTYRLQQASVSLILCISCQTACLLQRESAPSAYASWYPPVQQTLLCLSKLYRCVEAKVFAGLAQDAVSSCTKAVQVCFSSRRRDCTGLASPCRG